MVTGEHLGDALGKGTLLSRGRLEIDHVEIWVLRTQRFNIL